jgi:hypothetical protein
MYSILGDQYPDHESVGAFALYQLFQNLGKYHAFMIIILEKKCHIQVMYSDDTERLK